MAATAQPGMGTAGTTAGRGGKATLVVSVAALTVLSLVGGGIVGKLIAARLRAEPPATTATAAAADKASTYSGDMVVRELPAVVTNLAAPADMRVRLQVSVVFAKAAVTAPDVLMARLSDDIVAFLKTLSLTQLQGASGLQALREDLDERAAVRSDGKIREVIIETLVVQ